MVNSCTAINCTNRHGMVIGGEKLLFHRFPLSDATLLKQWVTALKRANFTPTQWSYICSAHFKETDYRHGKSSRKRLNKTAVPSVFNFDSYYHKIRGVKKVLNNDVETPGEDVEGCDTFIELGAVNDASTLPQDAETADESLATQDTDMPTPLEPVTVLSESPAVLYTNAKKVKRKAERQEAQTTIIFHRDSSSSLSSLLPLLHREGLASDPVLQVCSVGGHSAEFMDGLPSHRDSQGKKRKKKARDDDECDIYSKLLAKKLKKYPESMRGRMMYLIDGLLNRWSDLSTTS